MKYDFLIFSTFQSDLRGTFVRRTNLWGVGCKGLLIIVLPRFVSNSKLNKKFYPIMLVDSVR